MADQVRDLDAAIMNLPCNVPPMVVDDQAYKLGHRDARHAAAELAASHAAEVEALRSALQGLLHHVDRETCTHEDTYRGGAIWTICRQCDRKWADDRGGFQPHTDAPEVAAARAALKGDKP